MKNALEFLELLSIAVPSSTRHYLYVENGKLVVCVFADNLYQTYGFGAEDVAKEPVDLVAEIASSLGR